MDAQLAVLLIKQLVFRFTLNIQLSFDGTEMVLPWTVSHFAEILKEKLERNQHEQPIHQLDCCKGYIDDIFSIS